MEETTKTKKKIVNKEDSKKKERHIVTWSQQEDDILRKQISLHGTVNWAIIASNFTDKSTRQCRRRWYTYLNADFKRGGWSPEEDTLLCEAQRLFGNRWTEIAKVVSGRTDNAVKNRFTTLCKKRAKYEAMAKENNRIACCVNSNNNKMSLPDGISTPRKVESESPLAKKTRRSHIPDLKEISIYGDRSHLKVNSGVIVNQQVRPPLSSLATSIDSKEEQNQTECANEIHGEHRSHQEVSFKKDDPNVTDLMQQAELVSSLAQKVNSDTEQSMESAWKVLQDILNKSKENDIFRYGLPEIDFQLEEFKDLVEDLRSSTDDSQASWRQPDLHDSPASSEYSSGSTVIPQHPSGDTNHQSMSDTQTISQKQNGVELLQDKGIVSDATAEQVDLLSTCHDFLKNPNEIVSMSGEEEFNSPVQVTPLFRSLAAGIPSPQFSESERSFLLKTLGVESPCPSVNPSQPPCKRVLLDSL